MKKLNAVVLGILSAFIAPAKAFQVVDAAFMPDVWKDPTLKPYTIVYVDPRKVKVSVADALSQWPNGKCVLSADNVGTPFSCPGMLITNGFAFLDKVENNTISMTDQFFGYPDPRDPRKLLKVDGIKQKVGANFVVPSTCTTFGGFTPCTAPIIFKPLRLDFDHPVTHFSMQFRYMWGVSLPLFSDKTFMTVNGQAISAQWFNGTVVGNPFPYPAAGFDVINVAADPGETIQSIEFTPEFGATLPTGTVFGAFWYN